jgi:hypothetical protein
MYQYLFERVVKQDILPRYKSEEVIFQFEFPAFSGRLSYFSWIQKKAVGNL